MQCPKCQFQNRDGAKFCKKCGHTLEITCPKCGNMHLADSIFCDKCGHNLIAAPAEKYDLHKISQPLSISDSVNIIIINTRDIYSPTKDETVGFFYNYALFNVAQILLFYDFKMLCAWHFSCTFFNDHVLP